MAITRIREILADVDDNYLRLWLEEQPAGNISEDALEIFLERSLKEGYPLAEPPKPVWKSALEVAASMDFAEEVELHWAAELRGDTVALLNRPPQRSESYNLHALHTLLVKFPLIPKPTVRAAFLKAPSFHAAVARLESDIGNKQLKIARNVNKIPPPPVEVPLDLIKEIALPVERIESALASLRENRNERRNELKETGGLCTCSCCFDDELLPEEAIFCEGDAAEKTHSFCRSCVKNLAQNTFGNGLFAQNIQNACHASSSSSSSSTSSSSCGAPPKFDLSMTILCCPDTSGCSGRFSDRDLALALPTKDYKRYTSRSAALQALASGLNDLVPCPACEFVVEMSNLSDEVVRCLSSECGKVTCRWCGEPDHRPLRCDQVEKNAELKLRTFIEEQMTDAIARRCPNAQCRKAYDRIDGCNKMHCPCGTTFCYLCGEVLNNQRPYDHFVDGHTAGGDSQKDSKCTVYGTPAWAKPSPSAAKRQAEKALQEYLEAHPELQNLGGERIQSIKRRVGLVDEPTPVRNGKRPRADANARQRPRARPPAKPWYSGFECIVQ